ncbi:hypothetical protein HDF16_005610 [Granulicella aggregans]|uniref:Uncharacterized protein n=1 Tax=Granulicella aggregans TaxID=474949 RepID=A0A7W8E6Z8_9BACT|nr:hypothetical protein [Granulicella aggregans]
MNDKQKAAAAAHDADFTEAQAKAWERIVPTAQVIRIPPQTTIFTKRMSLRF